MKKLFVRRLATLASFLGVTLFATATPAETSNVSLISKLEAQVSNIETATVDKYGVVDLGIHDFVATTDILPLTNGLVHPSMDYNF